MKRKKLTFIYYKWNILVPFIILFINLIFQRLCVFYKMNKEINKTVFIKKYIKFKSKTENMSFEKAFK